MSMGLRFVFLAAIFVLQYKTFRKTIVNYYERAEIRWGGRIGEREEEPLDRQAYSVGFVQGAAGNKQYRDRAALAKRLRVKESKISKEVWDAYMKGRSDSV
jgi:hypothetical protein